MKVEDYKSFEDFKENFKLSEIALDMRELIRWNGRDIPEKENLSEHTHHVITILFELFEEYYKLGVRLTDEFKLKCIEAGLLHDCCEMYFGDILAVTKNTYPQIKHLIDDNEEEFMRDRIQGLKKEHALFVNVADKLSCHLFLKRLVTSHFCNEFIKSLYQNSKQWVQGAYESFDAYFGVQRTKYEEPVISMRLTKGYENDAGADIILDQDVEFLPHSSTEVCLNWNFNPPMNQTGLVLLRTSAGKMGLGINTSPIDPGFEGDTSVVIQNHSDNIVTFKKGEAFCQLVVFPFIKIEAPHRKQGERGSGKYGSSGSTGVAE